MADYTGTQLSGAGTPIEALNAGVTYDFVLIRPLNLSGSGYFTMETVRNENGFYDSTRPTNAVGVYDFTTEPGSILTPISSSYIMSSVVVPTSDNTSSFTFTPTENIAISSSFLRTTGGVTLTISGGGGGSTNHIITQGGDSIVTQNGDHIIIN